jgi:hypothetical protein
MRLLILLAFSSPAFAQRMVPVPFVSCKADTMIGPADAPKPPDKPPLAPAEAAPKLAYYESSVIFGVLAPRGWQCLATMGSAGSTLSVNGPAGATVQLSFRNGETSGRFDVAAVVARVFPAYADFAKSVAGEDLSRKLVYAPYPSDKLTYRSKSLVEFRTPANTEGLGTDAGLSKGALPIDGVAIVLGPPPGLVLLAVRLSPDLAKLAPVIISQVERDAPR